jgi:hypothetical protein
MAEVSGPVAVWNRQSVTNSALPKPQMVNNINMPKTNSSAPAQQSTNYGRSSSGGGSYTQAQVLANLQSALVQLNAGII